MKPALFLIAAAIVLAGCTATSPTIKEYTILPSAEPRVGVPSSRASLSLRVAAPKTPPSLASRNLCYLRGKNESGAYLYSRWSDNPSFMIERLLVSSLEEKLTYAVVLSPASIAEASHLLESELHAFHHRILPDGTSEGYIDFTCRLVNAKTRQTVANRRFRIVSASPSSDAQGGASALSEAARELTRQCTQWLIQQTQEKL